MECVLNLLDFIPIVSDFPKKGVGFRDVSPLLANPVAMTEAIEAMSKLFPIDSVDTIAGVESRGFIFGVALASFAKKPFIMIRKANKLPPETHRVSYELEYGSDHLEIRKNILSANSRVLIVDDVLATGGTLLAADQLVQMAGGATVGALTLLEIAALSGSQRLLERGLESRSVFRV